MACLKKKLFALCLAGKWRAARQARASRTSSELPSPQTYLRPIFCPFVNTALSPRNRFTLFIASYILPFYFVREKENKAKKKQKVTVSVDEEVSKAWTRLTPTQQQHNNHILNRIQNVISYIQQRSINCQCINTVPSSCKSTLFIANRLQLSKRTDFSMA